MLPSLFAGYAWCTECYPHCLQAMYGVLNAIEGCEAFGELEANSKIKPWFNRTKKAVTEHRGAHPLTK